jgi:hypothetical protein
MSIFSISNPDLRLRQSVPISVIGNPLRGLPWKDLRFLSGGRGSSHSFTKQKKVMELENQDIK